ncbi:MAG TPA: hypothetical protein VM509_11900, partial [Planctomycetota bacterium]|nr:hypothetical protein [Planctomycetota bacterium]
AALDARVVVVRDGESLDAARQTAADLGARTIVVYAELTAEDRDELAGLVTSVAEAAARRTAIAARFTRESSAVARVELERASTRAGGSFVVLSEPWSWYPGWQVRSTKEREPLPLRRADAIGTAVFVPGGDSELVAKYAPDSVRRGAWIGALGAVLTLCVIAWPRSK